MKLNMKIFVFIILTLVISAQNRKDQTIQFSAETAQVEIPQDSPNPVLTDTIDVVPIIPEATVLPEPAPVIIYKVPPVNYNSGSGSGYSYEYDYDYDYDYDFDDLDESIELKILLETAEGLERLERIKVKKLGLDLEKVTAMVRSKAVEVRNLNEHLNLLGKLPLLDENKFNKSVKKSIDRSFYFPQIRKVSIENKYGDITVTGYNGDSIKVQVEITAKSITVEKAQKALDRLDVKMKKWGSVFKIQTDSNSRPARLPVRDKEKDRQRDRSRERERLQEQYSEQSRTFGALAFMDKKSYTVDMTIYMPKGMAVIIENKYGEVNIEATEGNVEVDNYNGDISIFETKSVVILNKFGDTDIESILGDIEVENYNGDLQVKDVQGSVTAESKYSESDISNISGTVAIIGYNGNATLMNIDKSLTVENKYGDIEISSVDGDLAVENYNGNLQIEKIKGTLLVNNKYGDLSISEIMKGVNIENFNGDIELNDLSDSVFVSNKYGKITARSIDNGINFYNYNGDIKLESIGGEINVEILYGNLDIVSSMPKIKTSVFNGDVKIKKLNSGVLDIEIDSKYGKVRVEIPDEISAKFYLETKY
ncbi:MAG: hypothetical protein V3S48_00110, partial [Candidatus Neomarinimicrobiota bacterium]